MLIRLKINWKFNFLLVVVGATLTVALPSCADKTVDYGYGEYYVEIVTALDNHSFRLDNSTIIHDSNKTAKQTFASGDRVYMYFSYGNTPSDPIKVHGASKIFSDALKTVKEETIPQQTDDPVHLVSSWIGSYYLNLYFYFEYRYKAHKISLVIDEERVDDSEIHLYFRHDLNGDASGYPSPVYASFDLSKVLGEPQGDRNLFVHFNTTNFGNKIYTFKY